MRSNAHRLPRRAAPRTTPGSRARQYRIPGRRASSACAARASARRSGQIPPPRRPRAASITETLPIPARRNAKANAQPVCPPPTIRTLWSMPGSVRHPIGRFGADQPQRLAGAGIGVGHAVHTYGCPSPRPSPRKRGEGVRRCVTPRPARAGRGRGPRRRRGRVRGSMRRDVRRRAALSAPGRRNCRSPGRSRSPRRR